METGIVILSRDCSPNDVLPEIYETLRIEKASQEKWQGRLNGLTITQVETTNDHLHTIILSDGTRLTVSYDFPVRIVIA